MTLNTYLSEFEFCKIVNINWFLFYVLLGSGLNISISITKQFKTEYVIILKYSKNDYLFVYTRLKHSISTNNKT